MTEFPFIFWRTIPYSAGRDGWDVVSRSRIKLTHGLVIRSFSLSATPLTLLSNTVLFVLTALTRLILSPFSRGPAVGRISKLSWRKCFSQSLTLQFLCDPGETREGLHCNKITGIHTNTHHVHQGSRNLDSVTHT